MPNAARRASAAARAPAHLVQQPGQLGRAEIRVEQQPGARGDQRLVPARAARRRRRRCGGPARRSRDGSAARCARSQTSVVSRWLVMPIAGHVGHAPPRPAPAPRAAPRRRAATGPPDRARPSPAPDNAAAARAAPPPPDAAPGRGRRSRGSRSSPGRAPGPGRASAEAYTASLPEQPHMAADAVAEAAHSNFSFGLCTWSSSSPNPISRLSSPSTRSHALHHRDRAAAADQHRRAAIFLGQRRLRRRDERAVGRRPRCPGEALNTSTSILRVRRARARGRSAGTPPRRAAGSWPGTRRNDTLAPASAAITVLLPGP